MLHLTREPIGKSDQRVRVSLGDLPGQKAREGSLRPNEMARTSWELENGVSDVFEECVSFPPSCGPDGCVRGPL